MQPPTASDPRPAASVAEGAVIKAALVEDDAGLRRSLQRVLNCSPGFRCACSCGSGEEALKLIPRHRPDVVKRLLPQTGKQGAPITCRPADLLEPELDKAQAATQGIARDAGDVLIYALYPKIGMDFLRRKYGLETPPEKG